jgi:hypothetical protein
VHPWQGVPIVDRDNRVFPRKGHRVTLIGDLVDFHSLGERPRGHEIIYHATIPKLALDGVGVVQANLLKELLDVVRGQSCLTLAASYDSHGARHDGAACLLVNATIIIGRGCGLLAVLLAPLLAAPGALLDILDNDVR